MARPSRRNRPGVAAAGAVSRPSQAVEAARRGVPVEQQRAAADAGGLRLDQRQHGLRGDGGIDRAAAAAQHGEAGLGRQGVGGGDHVPPRRRLLLGTRRGGEEQQREQQEDRTHAVPHAPGPRGGEALRRHAARQAAVPERQRLGDMRAAHAPRSPARSAMRARDAQRAGIAARGQPQPVRRLLGQRRGLGVERERRPAAGLGLGIVARAVLAA